MQAFLSSENKDAKCFKQLDDQSIELRNAAENMANFLKTLKDKTPALSAFEDLFRKIKTAPITKMDICMRDLEKAFLTIRMQQCNDDHAAFSKLITNEEKLKFFFQMHETFNQEAVKLVKIAADINGK